jgi:hypothetical protein
MTGGSNAKPGSQEAAAFPQQPDEQSGKQAGQNRNIESTKTNAKSKLFFN